MKKLILLLLLAGIFSCNKKTEVIQDGSWRGTILIQNQELPFNFEIDGSKLGKPVFTLINADERLELDSVVIKEDSLIVRMHLFDAEIRARINGNELNGLFIKNYAKDYKLPFAAKHGVKERFNQKPAIVNLPEKFKVQFSDKADSVYSVGLIKTSANKITGTILTTTGDHRFLEGVTTQDSLFLSAFDGEHVYLYKAKINSDSSLSGQFWSGKSYNSSFTATPNDTIQLPDANTLTYLKPGYDKISFTFPGIDGREVSLENEKYKNKVVIVQLLGTWCPNCMDETKFLAPWYANNKQRGIEMIGLAYEKKDDFDYAKKRLNIMKQRLGVEYDLAFAGSSESENTARSLPMINKVLAFPTTIFIDKQGKVRKIHTGFSGPGTGKYYQEFVEEFNKTINDLLSE